MRNKRGWLACVLFVSVFAGIAVWRQCGTPAGMAYRYNEGVVFNTLYHIVYQSEEDYQSQIEEELRRRDTEGAFDPTVSPLINAWGFGFKNGVPMTPEIVDSLWHLVGMERVELLGGRLYKDDPRMTLNFSAIAKGYAVDVVASFLRGKGVENYLVEIGGEVVARGKNERGEIWRVGIDTPDEGNVAGGEIDAVVMLDDAALATSGNYRNFRIVDGRRVAHTINPATGYPVQHSLLSATVLASDCMTADAYATAFMVLGVEKSMEIASRHPEMEVYLIYAVDSVDVSVVMTPGMRQYIFGE